MTYHDDGREPEASEETATTTRRRFGKGRIAAAIVGVLILGGIALGAAGVSAHGDRGWGRHHGPVSLDSMQEHAKDKVAWLSGKVDASAEQQEDLEAIADALVTDLFPMLKQHRERRRALITELSRPEFDRAAVEAIRRDMIADLDSGSTSLVDALARASEVLTPEQRQELTERMTHRIGR